MSRIAGQGGIIGPGAASERRGPVSGGGGLVRLSSGSGLDPSARVRSSGVQPQTAAIAAAADPLSRNRLRDQAGIDGIFLTASSRMTTCNFQVCGVRGPA